MPETILPRDTKAVRWREVLLEQAAIRTASPRIALPNGVTIDLGDGLDSNSVNQFSMIDETNLPVDIDERKQTRLEKSEPILTEIKTSTHPKNSWARRSRMRPISGNTSSIILKATQN